MWTTSHRGYFIQGYCSTDICRVEQPDHTFLGLYNSLKGAKQAINRLIAKDKQLLAALGL